MASGIDDEVLKNLPKTPKMDFKPPSLEEFKEFLDKIKVPESDRDDYIKHFMDNKDKVFPLDGKINTEKLARDFHNITELQNSPNYIYFFVTIAVLIFVFEEKIAVEMATEPIKLNLNDFVGNPETDEATQALKDSMQTEEGRQMVDKLQEYFSNLNTKFQDMSEEEQVEFKEKIMGKLKGSLGNLQGEIKDKIMEAAKTKIYTNLILLVIVILIIISILGFFTYKIIKHVKSKEEKREKKTGKAIKATGKTSNKSNKKKA